ncbi:hypothetical protein Ga0100231_005400 [Opitutaceae bacterium TAV4]|nr:hypothetical protein Ga0100231_005400 [Opitutaceae bacterium TAV4]RRK02599.1 hypothetical protein Ga0100230_005650 [Opitutaceae bacterium TAV3]
MKPAHMFAALAGFAGVVAVAGWTTRRSRSQSANMSTATLPRPAPKAKRRPVLRRAKVARKIVPIEHLPEGAIKLTDERLRMINGADEFFPE